MMENEELELNFETGEIKRGETLIMTLDELLFLLDSANEYNDMFPIEQSQAFMAELRARIDLGFTPEQFAEIKGHLEVGEEAQ
ncbi:hypothetical protein [Paenibacillus sp. FSL R10-2771]|uniref:hypothetical protein n=1 Tax=Paenibacillus sp. FSL R10-2771 TaxID=2954693 RepID=UPI0030F8B517